MNGDRHEAAATRPWCSRSRVWSRRETYRTSTEPSRSLVRALRQARLRARTTEIGHREHGRRERVSLSQGGLEGAQQVRDAIRVIAYQLASGIGAPTVTAARP